MPADVASPRPHSDASAAIATLLRSHGPRLHSLALRLCGNAADAEDMVQDVFLQAFRKWHTFDGRSQPGTWLYAIAARACKARTRRKGGIDRRMPAMSQLMPWAETTVMRIAAADRENEKAPERAEAIAHVQAAIIRLPEHLRLPLIFKEVLGLSLADTAIALRLTANTVKTRLHRARLALRKSMTDGAAAVSAPAPIYEKQVCLDLLKAKMESMDRGGVSAGFKVPQAEVCRRCRAVFRELDLVQDACLQMGEGQMPAALRQSILRAITARDSDAGGGIASRRGRPPVSSSTIGAARSRRVRA